MDAVREGAQLVERGEDLRASARTAVRRSERGERDRERDQPLLRAVVQVALEAPALGVADLDDARARRRQLVRAGRADAREAACSSASRRRAPPRRGARAHAQAHGVAQLRERLAAARHGGDPAPAGGRAPAGRRRRRRCRRLREHDDEVGIAGALGERGAHGSREGSALSDDPGDRWLSHARAASSDRARRAPRPRAAALRRARGCAVASRGGPESRLARRTASPRAPRPPRRQRRAAPASRRRRRGSPSARREQRERAQAAAAA